MDQPQESLMASNEKKHGGIATVFDTVMTVGEENRQRGRHRGGEYCWANTKNGRWMTPHRYVRNMDNVW